MSPGAAKRWLPVYVGVGSNLHDPLAQVRAALSALGTLRETMSIKQSRCYASEPFGPVAQPQFVNAVAGLLTRLQLRPFFAELRQLEAALGRSPPRERWGPRVIDLDLLVFGRERCQDPDLVLPHPGIVERNFVLYPLAEIAADLDIPGVGKVADLMRASSTVGLRPLAS